MKVGLLVVSCFIMCIKCVDKFLCDALTQIGHQTEIEKSLGYDNHALCVIAQCSFLPCIRLISSSALSAALQRRCFGGIACSRRT